MLNILNRRSPFDASSGKVIVLYLEDLEEEERVQVLVEEARKEQDIIEALANYGGNG